MQITPVDLYQNLFLVTEVVSQDLLEKILSTPWMDLEYTTQPAQENWPRRLIIKTQLPWYQQWTDEFKACWSQLESNVGVKLEPYTDTAFWVDQPGFTCAIHTDGEMPGSLQLSWIGNSDLGTTFYHSKNPEHIRYRHDFQPNSGYAMINQADASGYRHLQWHGMLEPVPVDTFRLTSYTWLIPCK